MAEVTRAYEGGIGRGGIIVGALVVLVLISLFFIPEIIEFQRSFGGASPATKKTVATAPVETTSASSSETADEHSLAEIPATEEPSTLEKLSSLLDRPKAIKANREDARASLKAPAKQKSKLKPVVEDRGDKTDITWDNIRSGESKEALVKARKIAVDIAHKLPPQNDTSRYALLNFANGIDFLFDKAPETLNAHEAANYIRALDQSVARAMSQDNVDRSFAMRWSKVDFGPAILPGKEKIDVPFTPHLTLSWVTLRQRGIGDNPDPRSLIHVDAGGYVLGDDVAAIELVNSHGTVVRNLSLSKPIKDGGYRLFRFAVWSNEPWTIRVKDKFGKVYQKTYQFQGSVRQFPFYDNRYHLPFRMSFASVRRFVPEDIDPRLDSYFTRASWRGSEEELRAAYFGGGGGGGFGGSASNQLFANF